MRHNSQVDLSRSSVFSTLEGQSWVRLPSAVDVSFEGEFRKAPPAGSAHSYEESYRLQPEPLSSRGCSSCQTRPRRDS